MKKQKSKKKKFILRLLVIISLGIIFCTYEIYISYKHLEVNNYSITTSVTSRNAKIKFIVLGDLHDNEFGDNNKVLIKNIQSQKPDFILVAGDILNNTSKNSNIAISLVKNLVKIAPVYYALGNHELDFIQHKDSHLINKIEDSGATVLENKYKDIVVKGQKIRIGGMYSYAFGAGNNVDKETMDKKVYDFLEDFQNTSNYKIMMSHRPDSFIFGNVSKVWNIDLIVSAHNHGGQVILPFLGGLYGGDQGYFPKYIHGVYNKDKMKIAITSGLGSNPQKLPRFNNVPEIMVININ